jgi:phage/plasmid-associated DNA primase
MIHGLWTKQELQDIKEGKNDYLATVLLNEYTFSEEEIEVYNFLVREHNYETYHIWFEEQGMPVGIKAISYENLLQFVKEKYRFEMVVAIEKVKTTVEYTVMYERE